MGDGTPLAADIAYADDGAARPTLLIRTPYFRANAHAAYDLVNLARDGWSVVLQDVRGRGDSEGEFAPFDQEVDDGADAVAWCASQPWSDGRVVMTGVSYLGAAQWAAAARRPTALRGINPSLAPCASPHDWLWRGDAFQIGLAAMWTTTVLAGCDDPELRGRAQELAGSLGDIVATDVADDPLCTLSPHYKAWRHRQSPPGQPWLPSAVPAFNVVGWYDAFAETGLDAHRKQHEAGAPILTVVGPWAHNERLTSLYPEVDFGPLGNGELTDVRGQGLRWLSERLDDDSADTEVRYFVMGFGEWRTATTWPPPSRPHQLFLCADGRLDDGAPQQSTALRWRHTAADPVPTWGGRILGPFLPLPGPADQRGVDARSDVLVFDSDVLAAPVVVAGDVVATMAVSSTATSIDVVVKLSDVHPDGRVLAVVDDICRAEVKPGRPQSVAVAVGATAHAFLPGHRIRVAVAGSSLPRYDVNPRCNADHTLHVGGGASFVTLPVSQ